MTVKLQQVQEVLKVLMDRYFVYIKQVNPCEEHRIPYKEKVPKQDTVLNNLEISHEVKVYPRPQKTEAVG